jgi:hypothetical protein
LPPTLHSWSIHSNQWPKICILSSFSSRPFVGVDQHLEACI